MYGSCSYLDCASRKIQLNLHLTILTRQIALINLGDRHDKSYSIFTYIFGVPDKM